MPHQIALTFQHRSRKRAGLEDFFAQHIGESINSYRIHAMFGSGCGARISEINLDPSAAITIENFLHFDPEAATEISHYRAELRPVHKDLG
jgi:hypothetical protein